MSYIYNSYDDKFKQLEGKQTMNRTSNIAFDHLLETVLYGSTSLKSWPQVVKAFKPRIIHEVKGKSIHIKLGDCKYLITNSGTLGGHTYKRIMR